MTYTAPSSTTPSEQHIKFPGPISLSSPESPRLFPIPTGRLHIARSYSSPDHVRRHRRTPSFSKSFALPAFEGSPKLNYAFDNHASVRHSSPSLNKAVIHPVAVLSPPDSTQNSSDEEQPYQSRESIRLEDLEAAARSIEQKQESSLERKNPEEPQPSELPNAAAAPLTMKPESNADSPSSLPMTREGRKLSHSRSHTASAAVQRHEEAVTSSPEDSDCDDEPKQRPQMVRKKSGELVRPALRPAMSRRPSSVPGTPTYSKAVHFDSQLEYVRHFVQIDKPLAVSAETSPVDNYDSQQEFPFERHGPEFDWQLRLSNFPQDALRLRKKVQLEKLFLSSDNTTLVGTVAVANLAFHKHVAARFTFDYWKTVSEVTAEYNHDLCRKHAYDGYDRFSFSIKLGDQAHLENKTMFACIRYNVSGQEFWDNNSSMNYQADFVRVSKPKSEKRGSPTSGSHPALPRSRTFESSTGSGSRSLSMPRSIDDFSEVVDRRESKNNVKPLPHNVDDDMDTATPVRRGRSDRQAFSNRYDFEASLSALIRAKPTQDRTTLTAQAKSGKDTEEQTRGKRANGFTVEKSVPISQLSRQVAQSEHPKPSSLIHGKPHQDSSVYKELVDKYCFYGSSKNATNPKQMASEEEAANAPKGTASSSPDLSPTSSPVLPLPQHSASRSGSREPRTLSASGSNSRTPSSSSISLGYSYHQSLQNNFFNESHTPAVIRS